MIEQPAESRPTRVGSVTFAVTCVAMIIAAAFVMFSAFMLYDDEGYILLSLRNYAAHGGLYREVYSQYGPFPFVLYDIIQSLGLPLTHFSGRLITLSAWTIAAVSSAMIVHHSTRSQIASIAVLTATFLYLWIMASEPTHPGGIIVVLTALLATFAFRLTDLPRRSLHAAAIGAVITALLLTKVNVGIFALFSAGSWLLFHHHSAQIRRYAPFIAAVGAIVMAAALMRPLLSTPWVQTFAIVFASSSVAVFLSLRPSSTGIWGWRELGFASLAGGVLAAILLLAVIARGSSAGDILDGILMGPMRHPTAFSVRFNWPPGIVLFSLGSLALCTIACLLRPRSRPKADAVIVGVRILAAIGLGSTLLRFPSVSPDYIVFGGALPLLWVFIWPLVNESNRQNAGQAWMVLLLMGQALHVFPVPGSQIAWGTFLALPIVAIGTYNAVRWLGEREVSPERTLPWLKQICGLSTMTLTAVIAWKFGTLASRYAVGKNLALPGAEMIRVPDDAAAMLRLVAKNAQLYSDVLFSLPGTFSFNLWTGVPTPTGANVTHWFSLLNSTEQQRIVDRLKAHPRAGVIVWRGHLNFLAARGLAPKGLLYDYIIHDFEPAFSLSEVEFWVHKGRKIHPVMLAKSRHLIPPPGSTDSALLSLTVVPPLQPIAKIEVSTWEGNNRVLALDATNTRVEASRLNDTGDSWAIPAPLPWPLEITGPTTLFIYYDRAGNPLPAPEGTIVLRDAGNGESGLGRLLP